MCTPKLRNKRVAKISCNKVANLNAWLVKNWFWLVISKYSLASWLVS